MNKYNQDSFWSKCSGDKQYILLQHYPSRLTSSCACPDKDTKLNLVVSLQFWRIQLYCHYSQIPSQPEYLNKSKILVDWGLWHINRRILFVDKHEIYMVWFGRVLWHINHCRLYNAKSSLYMYIKYIWFWFGWVLWHINHCRLFNPKLFGLARFYSISTIVAYLIPNPLYTYMKYIFDLVGFYGISTFSGCLMPNPLCRYEYIWSENK